MRPEAMVGQILGHYRITRPLGYGGMATVFLAEDSNLHREVAVKVFMPEEGATQEFLHRFVREARVLAQLDHPNILLVYDYGEQNGMAYLVMPYIAGGSLRDFLLKRGSLPVQEAIQLSGQMLNALQYAHDRNLIHRDIKPGNMLLKTDGTLLLSDFGLVKILPSQTEISSAAPGTISGLAIMGTPDYMAPEQIIGQALPASDIYAMGAVIYEMLAGKRVFEGNNSMSVLMKHVHEQPQPLRVFNPQISPMLEAVIMRALEKDANKRYQRPADFLQALQQTVVIGRAIEDRNDVRSAPLSSSLPHPFSTKPPLPPDRDIHVQRSPSSPTEPDQQDSTTFILAKNQHLPNPIIPGSQPAQVQRPRLRTPLLATLILLLLLLVTTVGGVLYIRLPGQKPGNTPIPTPSQTAFPTDCPVPGTARPAIIDPLEPGNHQNIIYIANEGTSDAPTFGIVKRYDVTSGLKDIEISKMANTYIGEAQVSQNGQWILFSAKVAGQFQLRMVRIDGQELQTLYCAPANEAIRHVQWSFDERSVAFNVESGTITTYLLDTGTGGLQAELVSPSNLSYIPRTWLDNTHVYMAAIGTNPGTSAQDIYILGIQKGANQHDTDLTQIATGIQKCGSFDSSYDLTQLFISVCHTALPAGGRLEEPVGPSVITMQPVAGGTPQTIRTIPQAVTMIRAINSDTLLLLIQNASGDTSQNGLWKMSTAGAGLTRLTTDPNNTQLLCQFTQYAWSNVSPDGKMYALQSYDQNTHTYGMAFGMLDGSSFNAFASIADGTQLQLAGWATTNM